MRLSFGIVLLAALGVVAAPGRADDPGRSAERELARLQGVWGSNFANFYHTNGKEVVAQPVPMLTRTHRIRGNKWVELGADGKPTGVEKTIALDASSDPGRIRLTFTRTGEGGKPDEKVTEEGLYVLKGDELTVHLGGIGGGKPAPKQLLQRGKPVKGVDGVALRFIRVKDE